MIDHNTFNLQPGLNYTLWNTNQYPINNQSAPRHSSHPFFLAQLSNKKFIGGFMHNINGI